jgi:diguanylate cyclase (GGDEF)-like protein/PAS domain S-box-containing protein
MDLDRSPHAIAAPSVLGRTSAAHFERLVAASPLAIICADASLVVTYWNAAAERLFGWTPLEAVGRPITDLIPGPLLAASRAGLAALKTKAGATFVGDVIELVSPHRNGADISTEVTLSCWYEADGQPAFWITARDVTGKRDAETRLLHLAHNDPLTGLANRAFLTEALRRAEQQGVLVALILLNLDGFSHANDALGHEAGDALLREVAARMKLRLGDRGLLVRLGGDEFAVLLTDPAAASAPEAIAHELQDSLIPNLLFLGERIFAIGASAGVAAFRPGEAGTLLANADLALYRAKGLGRGMSLSFEPEMRADYDARQILEREVRQAAERREFTLLYQPQVRLPDRGFIGVEALLRWRHPTRGLLTPADFLSVLEVSAPSAEVGSWVIDEACRQAAVWWAMGLRLRVAVNVFPEQLRRGNLDRVVEEALARHTLPPEAIELELTERLVMTSADATLAPLWRLHARGVAIAFDDFGTGFASLSTLKRFPMTRLKIDRSFVTNLGADPYDAAIVEAVLALGRSLKLDIIAEGVETPMQEAYLIAHGCLEAQGYRYGRPMPADDIATAAGAADRLSQKA